MNKLLRYIVLALPIAAVLGASGQALAAEGDFRTGTFSGFWCGLEARFDISSESGDWVFDGKVLIVPTGEYDNIRVTQRNNNALRMVRFLTGQHQGKRQSVNTHPPKARSWGSEFVGPPGTGIGCNKNTVVNVPN